MRRFKSKEILDKVLAQLPTEEERQLIMEMDDPVLWLENHFLDPDMGEAAFQVKEHFKPVLRCNRKDRALRTGRQAGKCSTEFVKIQLADGSSPTTKEIYEKVGENGIFDIATTDINTFKHKAGKAIIVDNGTKNCTTISTNSGLETTNTDNHPYFIWRNDWEKPDWVAGDEVKIGDRIAVTRDLSAFSVSKELSTLNSLEGELLGYLIGDGGTSGRVIRFTTADQEIADRISTILIQLNTGTLLNKHVTKYSYGFALDKESPYYRGYGAVSWITEFVTTHNLQGKLSKNKEIPSSIFTSSNDVISEFLGAYWSTDGWVCDHTLKSAAHLGITSASKELINGTRTLLLRLGIKSRVRHRLVKYKDERRDCWELRLADSTDISKFKEKIKIRHPLKQDKLDNIKLKIPRSTTDTIPNGIWKYVESQRVNKDISKSKIIGNEYNANIRLKYNYSPNRSTLLRNCNSLNDHFIESISNSDIMWDTVSDIVDVGEYQTYAITVLETENLITDNFITHNTVHLCGDILHVGHFNKNQIILVFLPSKKNMDRMLEIMNNMLRTSDLKHAFTMNKTDGRGKGNEIAPKYDYEITCANGSVIRFFFMQNNPDKARGQTARGALYIDEAEYLPIKAFSVISGILKANPDISVWASSTPSGLTDTWFREFSDRCKDNNNLNGIEFHIPTYLESNWDEIEPRLRAVIFDDVTWKLEVEAEWATAKGAVYKKEMIDDAIERSLMGHNYLTKTSIMDTMQYIRAPKFIGVDWNNPQNGVRIVELARMGLTGQDLFWVVRNEIISYEQYTQSRAINRIMELFDEYGYRIISVDAGHGEYQIERLTQELVQRGREPHDILHVVDCNSGSEEVMIEYKSPLDGGIYREPVKIRMKDRIVNLVSKYLENNLALLKEDDMDKAGIVPEIRNFLRKETSLRGGFVYSDKTHSLSALQICIHGIETHYIDEDNSKPIIERLRSDALASMVNIRKDEQVQFQSFANMGRQSTRLSGLSDGRTRRSIL